LKFDIALCLKRVAKFANSHVKTAIAVAMLDQE
jgi:hypothetical protein